MEKVLIIILIIILTQGCTRKKNELKSQSVNSKDCNISILKKRVKDSPVRICQFKLLAKRCSQIDSCLLDCFTQKHGEKVSGGCYHICSVYSSFWSDGPWVKPEGYVNCNY